MRALVVTNMYPTPARPAFGSFVADQVEALRRLPGIDLDVHVLPGGSALRYARGAWELGRRLGHARFDVVHAHFGLSAGPALRVPAQVHGVTLHGTDITHPRSRALTLATLRRMDLVAAVSADLATQVPAWSTRRPVRVLPCGVALDRFQPIDRAPARTRLGLDPGEPCLLFPADPRRPEKRHDLAAALAARAGGAGVRLLALGSVAPDQVPFYVNAANAVLVPSDREGFGLAVLEALACNVPVLATPHGAAPEALDGVAGTLCAPFSLEAWAAALEPLVAAEDPRVEGRAVAERYGTDAMARRVADAWEELLGG
ncbi:MAG TPA: glycosyltransferase [Solirubrobacteraceae bacterium]|jgi:glycosyltransferase involved in cell wall biosynthesis|nr:glycosyltransferase [Solirubrobacteraceae bacterium]